MMSRIVIPIIVWALLLFYNVYVDMKTRKALDWQENWEVNGMLPEDIRQNERLNVIENRLGIGVYNGRDESKTNNRE